MSNVNYKSEHSFLEVSYLKVVQWSERGHVPDLGRRVVGD